VRISINLDIWHLYQYFGILGLFADFRPTSFIRGKSMTLALCCMRLS